MNKTLRISFALKNTYRVNSILYSIKQIPLLGKLFPETLYDRKWVKVLANILAGLWEVVMAFGGKLVYFVFLYSSVQGIGQVQDKQRLFLHVLIFLTIIGSFSNTFLFNPTKDKYYALILMKMDARAYNLWNYAYSLLKVLIGFGLFGILFGLQMSLPLWQCSLLPFFVMGIKATVAAYGLSRYEKTGVATDENRMGIWSWAVIILLLAAAFGLPVLGMMLSEEVSIIFMLACILTGTISGYKIVTFQEYQEVYRQLLRPEIVHVNISQKTVEEQIKQSHRDISDNVKISSNQKGIEYLNEIFIKRHQEILWKPAKIIMAAGAALVLVALAALYLKPDIREGMNGALMHLLPYFLFIMYTINRGAYYTRILFVNCDHSLLSYSFFRRPEFILELYQIRLRELIKMNLIPALEIGGGLALLLFCSGGTENPMDYVILIVSVACMSIFFSVHYLTIYYLLQPYNAGTEVKSATYQIVIAVTGFACYIIMTLRMPIAMFGLIMIIFSVCYCILASVLVYRFAPRTFKIRV